MFSKFIVLIDSTGGEFTPQSRRALSRAIMAAIAYAMDNDVRGAEALNRQDCASVKVETAAFSPENQ